MTRFQLVHYLRLALAVGGFFLVAGLGLTAWWLNHKGLPDSWRGEISELLAGRGIHAEIGKLRWVPLRGFVADSVNVFANGTRGHVAAELERLSFTLDRSKLVRGEIQVNQLRFRNARVALPADPEDPESRELEVTGLNGNMKFIGQRTLSVSRAAGLIGGVKVSVEGSLELPTGPPDEADEEFRDRRRQVLTGLVEALDTIRLDPAHPPTVHVRGTGDFNDPEKTRATIILQARDVRGRSIELERLDARGEVRGRMLSLRQLDALCAGGKVAASCDYDLVARKGVFEWRSSAAILKLAQDFGLPLPEPLPTFARPPQLDVNGSFLQGEEGWRYRLIGRVALDRPRYRNFHAERVGFGFSASDGRLYLQEVKIRQAGEQFAGRVFIDHEKVRYEGRSTLPLDWWKENLSGDEDARGILDMFASEPGFHADVTFRGDFVRGQSEEWRFSGVGSAGRFRYEGVPVAHAEARLQFDHKLLEFSDGTVTYDYAGYPLRKRYGGPATGTAKVARVRYMHHEDRVTVEGLSGQFWPGPVVRCFAPELAKKVETYRFHRPPDLAASGVIDWSQNPSQQDFSVAFNTDSVAQYELLRHDLTLVRPSGVVRILPDRTVVDRLQAQVFQGGLRASLTQHHTRGERMEGELDWTDIDLPQLARTYKLASHPPGRVTGRFEFTLKEGRISSLGGKGNIALEGSRLFEVPMFGPLSPVLATVLDRKVSGFQEADSAFCTFTAHNGVFQTGDFLTTTSSLVFTGDGWADFNTQTMNLTIRMNARGLLGLITFPLRPFYGLFQFRGSGPMEAPHWGHVAFTQPPESQNRTLLSGPKASAPERPRKAVPVER